MSPTSDEKYTQTITHTNGEMILVLAAMFDIPAEQVCRWGIVITSHVPGQPSAIHDIRVAANCEDPDIPALLKLGLAAL